MEGFKLTNDTSDMLELSGLVRVKPISKNVNEEFVLKTIANFFNKVGIDGDEILNTMPDDLPYAEAWQDIMKIINLESALSTILKHLFIKDFTVSDIINPGAKRINKCLRYLSNFLIYYSTKMSEIEERLNIINDKRKKLKKLINESKSYEEKIVNIITQKQTLLKENEKLMQQIEEIKNRLTEKSKQKAILQKALNEAREKHEQNKQIMSNHKTELLQIQQFKANLEKKLVKSPCKIDDQLNKLNKLKEEKMIEMTNVKKSMVETNKFLDHQNKTYHFLEQLLNKCQECFEVKEKYVTAKENASLLNKQLSKMKELNEKKKKDKLNNSSKNHHDNENFESLKTKYEEKIEQLLLQRSNLKREIAESEKEVQSLLTEKEKIGEKKKYTEDLILQLEKENQIFINESKELYLKQLAEIIKKQEEIEQILGDFIN